ncbi:16S rRNA (cytidine(1402)-2'-O)-methyltransferase [Gracilibacillus marinus]|jgi:16S rRNA (cytidine1402-2'-O)-methyltransferase|uniref:Ribosomal RNA small subunit methyltransferase I n=1 Tax=Gracilibacillus marinus TaxID=630535 RepID=A0ABV8VZE7_9BACI
MRIQKSFQKDDQKGTLYIVPTPIGNLEDITMRALRILKEVEFILAEDTRNTGKLLHYFEIKKTMISYHEHNKLSREEQIIDKLSNGSDIALVSDAGMPGISDPGYEIIQAAIEADITIVVLPGASAAICALVGSGLPTDHFYFYGFLPRKNKERKQALSYLQQLETTFILYESPHRLKDTLMDLRDTLGNCKISIARELTKKFEEFIRGDLEEIAQWASDQTFKGELCLVIEGKKVDKVNWWEELSIEEHITLVMKENEVSSKEAIKQVAKDRDLPKREVYQIYHR